MNIPVLLPINHTLYTNCIYIFVTRCTMCLSNKLPELYQNLILLLFSIYRKLCNVNRTEHLSHMSVNCSVFPFWLQIMDKLMLIFANAPLRHVHFKEADLNSNI